MATQPVWELMASYAKRRVGITGTTRGLAPEQRAALHRLLTEQIMAGADVVELRHGDCVGVDAQAAEMARGLGFRIVGHPDVDPDGRAYAPCDRLLPERESAARNRAIVDASDVLIGCPAADQEWPGSGTWYTINYARRSGTPVVVVSPSGRVLHDTRPASREQHGGGGR